MYFNVSYFQAIVPKLFIGGRRFKINFNDDYGLSIIVKTYDNYLNEQIVFFSIKLMAVESMTQLSTKENGMLLSNIIHFVPNKVCSEFDTYKVLKQFNLYVHYVILSFNLMYWR
ncbi:MAG: hypothetical protein HG453_001035 [Clostridiales bacterium]|nr:hypothetical protein [Clostridiales bacterium]